MCVVHTLHACIRVHVHMLQYRYVLLQHRRLDAVYYYIRSLTASNPFLSAKESLAALFDETSKKVAILLYCLCSLYILYKAEMEDEKLKMDEEKRRKRSERKQRRQDKQSSDLRCG